MLLRSLFVLWASFITCVALFGCSNGDARTGSPVRLTKRVSMFPGLSPSDLPEGCRLTQVQSRINKFLSSLNKGSRKEIVATVAALPELNEIAFGRAGAPPLKTPQDVVRKAKASQKLGVRRTLESAQVQPITPPAGRRAGPYGRPHHGPRADDSIVAVGLRLSLHRPNRPSELVHGKAGLNCDTGRFYVWGTG